MPRVWKRSKHKGRKDQPYSVTWTDWVSVQGTWVSKERSQTAFSDARESMALGIKLEDQARRRKFGLVDEAAERSATEGRRPLAEHIEQFRTHLEAKGNTAQHTRETITLVSTSAEACGWRTLPDISAASLSTYLKQRADGGISARTINKTRGAVRSFSRWLQREGRHNFDPVLNVPSRREQDDKRHDRRPMDDAEFVALLATAENSRTDWIQRDKRGREVLRLTGPERAMLYRLAVGTGLRAGEIRSLTPQSFNLAAPNVTVEAAYSKRRTRDVQPFRRDLAAKLQPFLKSLPRTKQIWNVPNKAGKMIQADMADARAKWISEATSEAERLRREESNFLSARDDAGRVFDFHALRHTYITRLARAGVSPKVAQTLARHSTITLTMDRYAHIDLVDQRAALDSLPSMGEDRKQAAAKKTGTHDAPPSTPKARKPLPPLRLRHPPEAAPTPPGAQRHAQRTQVPVCHTLALSGTSGERTKGRSNRKKPRANQSEKADS